MSEQISLELKNLIDNITMIYGNKITSIQLIENILNICKKEITIIKIYIFGKSDTKFLKFINKYECEFINIDNYEDWLNNFMPIYLDTIITEPHNWTPINLNEQILFIFDDCEKLKKTKRLLDIIYSAKHYKIMVICLLDTNINTYIINLFNENACIKIFTSQNITQKYFNSYKTQYFNSYITQNITDIQYYIKKVFEKTDQYFIFYKFNDLQNKFKYLSNFEFNWELII